VARAVPFYNEKDVAGIRAACRLGREILDTAHRAIRPGITTGAGQMQAFHLGASPRVHYHAFITKGTSPRAQARRVHVTGTQSGWLHVEGFCLHLHVLQGQWRGHAGRFSHAVWSVLLYLWTLELQLDCWPV